MQILPNIYSVSLLLWYCPQDTLYEGRTTRVTRRRGAVPHQPVQQGLRLLLLVVFVRVGLGGRRCRAAFTIDVLLPVITPSLTVKRILLRFEDKGTVSGYWW